MGKFIREVFKTDTLSLIERSDGYYLFDTFLGYNISLRAKSEQAALIEGLHLYQKYYCESNKRYNELNATVEYFISEFYRES